MLINFSIRNFGSIKDKQTLSFEADKSKHLDNYYVIETNGLRLLKLGLIYGANASGKTTILKALQFFIDIVLEPCEQKNQSLDVKPFLFDADTPKQNTVFEVEFLQNEVRYSYEVEFCENAIIREVLFANENPDNNRNKSKVFDRTTDTEKQLTNIVFGSKIKINQTIKETLIANTLWNNTVLGGFLKTNMELKELTDVTNWFKNYLNAVIYTKTELDVFITQCIDKSYINKNIVLNILGKADFNLSDILIKRKEEDIPAELIEMLEKRTEDVKIRELKEKGKITRIILEFEHSVGENSYCLPLKEESQGTQRYFDFAGILCLLISKSTLFSIDELESSLHPDLFRHFLLSFLVNSKRSQLLATTHNREILNDKDIFRNDAIWITDKNNAECATELYSLADFDTSVIRDTSNIFNAYKTGKLGGAPNLGSYYINIDEDENK